MLSLGLTPVEISAQYANGAGSLGNYNGPAGAAPTIARVAAAPMGFNGMNVNPGLSAGGIRFVTLQTPMVYRHNAARQFFAAGGINIAPNQFPIAAQNAYPVNAQNAYPMAATAIPSLRRPVGLVSR